MNTQKLVTNTADETKKAGSDFVKKLKVGDVVLLEGALGAGKTTFVQGAAKALKIKTRIISPSFILIRSHKAALNNQKINLYHIDLYRIENESEIRNLGLEDIVSDSLGVTFIEWGRRTNEIKYDWEIKFEIEGQNRKIAIKKNE